jgi:hypothetical protein
MFSEAHFAQAIEIPKQGSDMAEESADPAQRVNYNNIPQRFHATPLLPFPVEA